MYISSIANSSARIFAIQHQWIAITATIVIQTAEFQQGFETGTKGGLCGGDFRFKLEPPASEESIAAIVRNLYE